VEAAVSGLAIAACDGERVAQCSMMRPQRPALGTSAPPATPIPGCDHEEKSHTGTAAHDEAAPLKRTAQHDDGHAKSGGDDGGDGGGGSGGGGSAGEGDTGMHAAQSSAHSVATVVRAATSALPCELCSHSIRAPQVYTPLCAHGVSHTSSQAAPTARLLMAAATMGSAVH
jgi:hypothetical protein